MAVSATPTELETLSSLRRRGLISAAAYRLHVESLSARADEPIGRSAAWMQPFAILTAVVGCVLAIPAVLFQEIQDGGFIGAAVIEEALKPAGVFVLMLRWPRALRGRLHVAFLCALAGLTFGLIESYVYVTLYFPDEGSNYVLFRFTVPVALHVVASTIVGLGLSRTIIDWAAGRAPFPKRTRNFYFAAVALHAIYNTVAIVLTLTGVVEFD